MYIPAWNIFNSCHSIREYKRPAKKSSLLTNHLNVTMADYYITRVISECKTEEELDAVMQIF